jgi:uncharacterized phosphosugar-binding protein
MIVKYFEEVKKLLNQIEQQEIEEMNRAAEMISKVVQNDGIIYMFGCGHSHILTEDMYYRAGGLVPVQPILHEPLMLHEGPVTSSELEKTNQYAATFIKDFNITDQDLVIIISTSGRNPVPVDVAIYANAKGAKTIGITSIKYSSSQTSRHHDGKKLMEVVDIVINNYAPPGDAMMSHPKMAEKFTSSSTVIGSAILNSIFAEAINRMKNAGYEPPIFMSGNLEGTSEHNQALIEKYKDRVKLD